LSSSDDDIDSLDSFTLSNTDHTLSQQSQKKIVNKGRWLKEEVIFVHALKIQVVFIRNIFI